VGSTVGITVGIRNQGRATVPALNYGNIMSSTVQVELPPGVKAARIPSACHAVVPEGWPGPGEHPLYLCPVDKALARGDKVTFSFAIIPTRAMVKAEGQIWVRAIHSEGEVRTGQDFAPLYVTAAQPGSGSTGPAGGGATSSAAPGGGGDAGSAGTGSSTGSSGELASTGSSGSGPLLAVGGAAIGLGALSLLAVELRRRRRTAA
jgi:hypothetical protein